MTTLQIKNKQISSTILCPIKAIYHTFSRQIALETMVPSLEIMDTTLEVKNLHHMIALFNLNLKLPKAAYQRSLRVNSCLQGQTNLNSTQQYLVKFVNFVNLTTLHHPYTCQILLPNFKIKFTFKVKNTYPRIKKLLKIM